MDYHSDRFEDFSLMVFKGENLIALLPGNKKGKTLFSHQGLSYGGLIVSKKIRTIDYIETFSTLLKWLNTKGVLEMRIKQLPFIYNKHLTQEFEYIMHDIDCKVVANNSYYVLDQLQQYKPNRNRLRGIKKGKDVMTLEDSGMDYFWEHVLTKNLCDKFGVMPVHTYQEIVLLQSKFPNQIKFYSAKEGGIIHAGALLFITDNVVHFQYSSGKENRDETGALDFLFDAIIRKYSEYKYISFGSSATDDTLKIDSGLAYWKESFGAYLIPQRTYAIKTNSIINLETYII
ncbi:hypothetical protein [Lacinutrix jangbogonensis]|uniref:hypothetical protein n=1 Tax=Lacinutrix jangbogonensis TaxID=1469557 RepID=UPI00068A5AB2|nr:hypothetical protein [Lacinutrix jangbogonensis]